MSFESNILALKIRINKLVIALANKVYILNFYDLEVENVIPTIRFP